MSDIFGQKKSVKNFLNAVKEGNTRKVFKKFPVNHKFKDNKRDVLHHYFLIVNIEETIAKHFEGVTSPVPRFGRIHKAVRGFGAWSEKKDFLNLFPESSVSDIRCTGNDTCLVCQRIAENFERLGIEKVNKKWMAPDTLSNDDKSIAEQLISGVDGSLRGKKKVVFAGLVFKRNPETKKLEISGFERFVMSDFYWNRDFHSVLFETREEVKDDWVYDEHADDEFTLKIGETEVTQKLCEFKEAEQNIIFLENTECSKPIPWDMIDGTLLHYEEKGEVQQAGVVTHKKNMPYFPPAVVETVEDKDLKAKLKKLSKKSNMIYSYILDNIQDLKDIDIDKYFPNEMTGEKQAELLCIDKEKVTENKMDDVVKEEEEIEDVFEDTSETEEEIGTGIKEAVEEVEDEDDSLFEDDEIPF